MFAPVCSFVQCDSGTFLKFWLDDQCRDTFLSYVPKKDLASLRLACHDFGVRAGPALFADLSITFKTSTFTRPARLAALDRLGFYVKNLRFHIPHTVDTFLPPLVDPDTGEELSFTYTPQIRPPARGQPKYGDLGTTEVLTRQYPPLFHAATNVPAFVRAFSAFVNLQHVKVSCPGYEPANKNRRSIVDFALISLRIAIEQSNLNALDSLTLAPIHSGGLLYLSPSLAYGATPRSARCWSRIRHLSIQQICPSSVLSNDGPDQLKLLQTYLRSFQRDLETFDFRWVGGTGPLPTYVQKADDGHKISSPSLDRHPSDDRRRERHMHFPKLQRLTISNATSTSTAINSLVSSHGPTLRQVEFSDVELTSGTWQDALSPLSPQAHRRSNEEELADIPIMLSPTTAAPVPLPCRDAPIGRPREEKANPRLSRWFRSKGGTPSSPLKAHRGLSGCEGQLKRIFKGGVFSW